MKTPAPATKTKRPGSQPAADAPQRVAKVMARAGLCSRREAERMIADGRVAVNGTVLKTPAVTVTSSDQVSVDGAPLPAAQAVRVWRLHKHGGQVTSNADPQGRPTIFQTLPAMLPRVMTIGRLDINTEGLLLLTNDGALARHLELPATGWIRHYRVRVFGHVNQKTLDRLEKGITLEGVRYGPVKATLERASGHNSWLEVALKEGKNREIKRLLGALDLKVNRLIRTGFGPFRLGGLKPGEVIEVPRKVLNEQLGSAMLNSLESASSAHRRRRS